VPLIDREIKVRFLTEALFSRSPHRFWGPRTSSKSVRGVFPPK